MIGSIILQIVLILLNAIFASAEIAVISMNDAKLKRMTADGDVRAVKLSALIEQPARFLATIQVAITLAGLLGSAFAADNFAEPLVAALINAGITIPKPILQSSSVFIITLILAYFSLVFGELVPKRIAMKKAESMALGMSGMLNLVSKVFKPLVLLLTASTNLILRMIGIDPNAEDEKVTEEEIRMLLMTGKQQGTIDTQENEIIQNVFEFDDITVGEICTHRIEVVALNMADSLAEWIDVIHNSRHSYYPIYGENSDDIVGVLDTKDYFRSADQTKEYLLGHAVDQAYFIPERMKANALFKNMKHYRKYFAVVVDEYGGVQGIITLHDLVEALMGELDESGEPIKPKDIEKIGDNQWKIQGYANLRDVEDELGVNLPTDIYDTYSGFICGVIKRVPNHGESFELEYRGLNIKVNTVLNHIIGDTFVQR